MLQIAQFLAKSLVLFNKNTVCNHSLCKCVFI
nr:MAG TPA: hypothetical protein [Caudoviricetes sp.]